MVFDKISCERFNEGFSACRNGFLIKINERFRTLFCKPLLIYQFPIPLPEKIYNTYGMYIEL